MAAVADRPLACALPEPAPDGPTVEYTAQTTADPPASLTSRSRALCAAEATLLLEVVEACLHARSSEWIFLRELRVGTGLQRGSGQRLDAFALNCLAHTAMKRICYEVKTSRADFLCEMKQPLKRRCGLRYSNEFYFVTPAGLLEVSEVPIECGLVEVGSFEGEDFAHFDPLRGAYCRVSVPAPWRETPGPTWQFVAGMLRNQRYELKGRPPKQPNQQKLPFGD